MILTSVVGDVHSVLGYVPWETNSEKEVCMQELSREKGRGGALRNNTGKGMRTADSIRGEDELWWSCHRDLSHRGL